MTLLQPATFLGTPSLRQVSNTQTVYQGWGHNGFYNLTEGARAAADAWRVLVSHFIGEKMYHGVCRKLNTKSVTLKPWDIYLFIVMTLKTLENG